VGAHGPYDRFDLWQSDLDSNPAPEQQPVTRMLGATQLYFDASPVRHVSYRKNALKTLLIWGSHDALPVVGAGHFWFSEDPIDEPRGFTWAVAPRVLRFVQQHLGGSAIAPPAPQWQ
jgi:hypothetical protein